MSLLLALGVVVFFSLLAFWKYDTLMFMLTAGSSIMTGFYWYDTYTTNIGLTVGTLLVAYSLICPVFALGCLFRREQNWEEKR